MLHWSQNRVFTAKHNPIKGFVYIFLATLISQLQSVIVKKLWYISPSQLSLIRNAGIFAVTLPIALYCNKNVIGDKRDTILLLTRGFFGANALYLIIMAYSYLPLAEAAIVLSIVPVTTSIMARIFLKEPCGCVLIFSSVTTICGVFLTVWFPPQISKSDFNHTDYTNLSGLAAAFSSVIILSVTFVTLRKMKDIHFSMPMLYYSFVGLIENATITLATSTYVSPTCGWDHLWYISSGVLGFIGSYFFTLSLQVEAAGIVSILRSSLSIIIAIIFQISLFNEKLNTYNIVGAALIILSVSTIGIKNWLSVLPDQSKVKKRLKCFLL